MHSVQERPVACHPACNYKSAAHRGLENARTRSRHPKTQKQHATNQPAPARVLTPRQGQRHPTRISNRTRHRARPRGAGLSIGQRAQAHNHGPSRASRAATPRDSAPPSALHEPARRPGARCHHRDGPTAGKKPRPRHNDPNDTTAEAARARWGEGRIWRAPALAAVAFSESSTIGRTTAGGAWTPAAARQSAIPCRIAWAKCTMPAQPARTCPTSTQLPGPLDAQHCHHSLPAAQHAALKRLQLRRDVAAVALAHSTQPHPVGHEHTHSLVAVLVGVQERAINGRATVLVARPQVRTRGAQHLQHAGLLPRSSHVSGRPTALVARAHIHQPASAAAPQRPPRWGRSKRGGGGWCRCPRPAPPSARAAAS